MTRRDCLQGCLTALFATPVLIPRPVKVLFIGNSLTLQNDLPTVFAKLAASATEGPAVETGMVARGGYSLERHWRKGEAVKTIQESRPDFVVLQEQSQLNAGDMTKQPRSFFEFARRFDTEIRQAKATTVFYLTWAREDVPELQAKVTEAYRAAARDLSAVLAPVGPAFQNARLEQPELRLYRADRLHPLPAGTYLAACVFYAAILRRSPVGLASRFVLDKPGARAEAKSAILADEEAAFLQQIAWRTVEADPLVRLVSSDSRVGPVHRIPPLRSSANSRLKQLADSRASRRVSRP